MSRQRTIFWVGLLIYAAISFLFDVTGRGPGRGSGRGYVSAGVSLVLPWRRHPISNHLDEVKIRFFGDTAVAQGSESWDS